VRKKGGERKGSIGGKKREYPGEWVGSIRRGKGGEKRREGKREGGSGAERRGITGVEEED